MKATFGTTKKGTWAYIQKSVRIGGKSTTKTHLEVRPVYLSRQDRIRSHFLVCFLALLLLKLLQKQLADSFPEAYKERPLAVDQLIDTLQNLRFGQIQRLGYVPMFQRTSLTDQLQELAGVEVNKQIITKAAMNAIYRKVNKGQSLQHRKISHITLLCKVLYINILIQ